MIARRRFFRFSKHLPRMGRGLTLLLLGVSLLAAMLLTLPPVNHSQAGLRYQVENEFILRYKTPADRQAIEQRVNSAGGQIINEIPQLNALLVSLPRQPEATAQSLAMLPQVSFVEPNLIRTTQATPNDPQRTQQWGLGAINAYTAWDTAKGAGATIAVLDSGIDLNHPDLAAHVLNGYDFVYYDNNPSPMAPDEQHGSHVMGIANAVTDNGVGMAGVAWDARTIPVRVINEFGGASSASIAAGLVYAADRGATVVNMSLGGEGFVQIEEDAVNYAAAHGVVIVAASGNSYGSTPQYPASYDHVISVAATDINNNKANFSTYNAFVDIAAPGVSIYSAVYDNAYDTWNGTSMATPHVAGVAALIKSAGHATSAEAITEALLCTTVDLGPGGRDNNFGWGLVQADAAVLYNPGASCLPQVQNDDIDNAKAISRGIYTDSVNAFYATTWEDDPINVSCANALRVNRTVWYTFTPSSGEWTLSTAGSNYDTVLAVFTGSRGSLTEVACNDNAQGATSELQINAQGGQSYLVMVASGSFESTAGNLEFRSAQADLPPAGCQVLPGTSIVICAE